MPRVRWLGRDDVEVLAAKLGPRLRRLREARGLTIRELAERAEASKNTVLRLEQGLPIAEKLMVRICSALCTIPPNLLISDETWELPFRVHRAETGSYQIAFRRKKAPSAYENYQPVPLAAERNRIGNLGFVTGFFQMHDATLPEGRIQSGILELYGDKEGPGFRHAGEEMVYVLEGKLKLTVDNQVLFLSPGDAATFDSSKWHNYESALPLQPGQPPTRVLMVWIEGVEGELDHKAPDGSPAPG